MARREEIAELAVKLSLEAQSFSKQMTTINKEIKNLDKDFKNAGKGVTNFEKTFTGLDKKIQTAEKQIALYTTKLKEQKSEYERLDGVLKDHKKVTSLF